MVGHHNCQGLRAAASKFWCVLQVLVCVASLVQHGWLRLGLLLAAKHWPSTDRCICHGATGIPCMDDRSMRHVPLAPGETRWPLLQEGPYTLLMVLGLSG